MMHQNTIPDSVNEKLGSLFPPPLIFKAKQTVRQGLASLSFVKESKSFSIISGIIAEEEPHTARINIKEREGKLIVNSNCNCVAWNENNHCSHVAALYLKYLLKTLEQDGWDNTAQSFDFGVSPKRFGSQVLNPRQLENAPTKCSFASLNYVLTNKKVVHFSTPKPFADRALKFYFTQNHFEQDTVINSLNQDHYRFSLKLTLIENGEEFKEVSVFDNLYLFNWRNGEIFDLPDSFKSFFKIWKQKGSFFTLNDILRTTRELRQDKKLLINYGDFDLPETHESLRIAVNIQPSTKKNHFSLVLSAFDSEKQKVELPQTFGICAFNGGFLESFYRKNDAYDFLERLAENFETPDSPPTLTVRNSKKREVLESLSSYIRNFKEEEIYSESLKKVYSFDLGFLREFIKLTIKSFSKSFFRFSDIVDQKDLVFEIPQAMMLEGLSNFHESLKEFDVDFSFHQQPIQYWRGNIRFERKEMGNDWFDLKIDVDSEDMEILSQANLLSNFAMTSKGLFLLTKEQTTLLQFLQKYQQEAKGKKDADNKLVIPFTKARIFELFELRKLGINNILTKEEENLCENLATLEKIPEYPIPEKTKNVLRPYQKTGFNWLSFLYEHKLGACLADDMGLGKTIQTISFLESVVDRVDRILIVCPVSILINWEKEIEKFSNLQYTSFYGGNRTLDPNSKIIITSYGILKKEINSKLEELNFDIIVFDEVHHLKNIKSLGAIAARKLNGQFRICLTGTPVENDLSEFYNLMDLALPGLWGNINSLRNSSVKTSRSYARATAKPFILRRTKPQVLSDLPEKEENYVYLNFSREERENYLKKMIDIKEQINNVKKRNRYGEILKSLLTLRQACLWQQEEQFRSTKIDFLMENLRDIKKEGHQAIIFSQFTRYLNYIQNYIVQNGWNYSRIDGSQSIKKRQGQVEEFQNGNNQFFLISLKAGGVGLNLTAASYVFLMDPWWNPSVESQAIDRAHRIGQKNKLIVYRAIIKDSIEEKVLKLQQFKRELFQDLLENDQGNDFSGKLSMKDFEALLEI